MGSLYYYLTCPRDTAWTSLVASPSFVPVPGYVVLFRQYPSTSCTDKPSFVQYAALGVCMSYSADVPRRTLYFIFNADASGTIYASWYFDTACTLPATALNVKVVPEQCGGRNAYGYQYSVDSFLYSAQAPDNFIAVNTSLPAGALLARYIVYQAGDTTCSKTPQRLAYSPMQSCVLNTGPGPDNLGSIKYVADVTGRLFYKWFIGTTTCTSNKGMVIVSDLTSSSSTCSPDDSEPVTYWKIVGKSLLSSLAPSITSTRM
jgi:hypothetical protein